MLSSGFSRAVLERLWKGCYLGTEISCGKRMGWERCQAEGSVEQQGMWPVSICSYPGRTWPMSSPVMSGNSAQVEAEGSQGQATKALGHLEELGLPHEGRVRAVTHQRIKTCYLSFHHGSD